jgi:hypothetical protein
MNQEESRLSEAREQQVPWKKWGPYLSERQWGTVREDYSLTGNAWDYFTHDQARSRAYRWGEDGLAGISDDQQLLCFALALWNGHDPILKERLFGLTNTEGNHGEDCKEYYFYLDATPTYSYMKYLYKYPQRAYPYDDLLRTNRQRNHCEHEYELLDTGSFDDDRYFDVFVEYAKASAEDLLIQISVWNRGPEAALLHLLPTLWFRNTWSWSPDAPKPLIRVMGQNGLSTGLETSHPLLGEMVLHCDRSVPLLFTENETNMARIFELPNRQPYVKDGINNYVVNGQTDAVTPFRIGTKAAAHYRLEIGPGAVETVRLRLSNRGKPGQGAHQHGATPLFGTQFTECLRQRQREADEFYKQITPSQLSEDAARVMRQAFAGLLWTMQFYLYQVDDWLSELTAYQTSNGRPSVARNGNWTHLECADLISVPDKWEYPWLATWDLAFHAIALARVDPDLAKQQLRLITQQFYAHPNGQFPAYEWNFSDVNPPVHASATWQVYLLDKALRGKGDVEFLESVFHRLLLNFTWWMNQKDRAGRNVCEGGFLGLDNFGVFDRSAPLATGGYIEEADGTSWMAVYALDMLTIALELSFYNPVYQGLASKFYEHFIHIAAAMDRIGEHKDEMWDEEDGFFYDVLRLPNGEDFRLKLRSMVGLVPLFASAVFAPEVYERLPEFINRVRRFNLRHTNLLARINPPGELGVDGQRLLAIVNRAKLRRILARMLDESEFLSQYGIRSLSQRHREDRYHLRFGADLYRVEYEPAESTSVTFGGNTNWRGPIWMPVNGLLLQGLLKFHAFYGDDFQVECPTGSGKLMNLQEVAQELQRRLISIFLRDSEGRRPVYGGTQKFQNDPHWRNLILFYEYFHGDNGAGIGASHQTGWTGLVARFLQAVDVTAAAPQLQTYTQLLFQYAGKVSARVARR